MFSSKSIQLITLFVYVSLWSSSDLWTILLWILFIYFYVCCWTWISNLWRIFLWIIYIYLL